MPPFDFQRVIEIAKYLPVLKPAGLKEIIYKCSVSVECLTWDQGVAGSSLTGVPVLCPRSRHFILC